MHFKTSQAQLAQKLAKDFQQSKLGTENYGQGLNFAHCSDPSQSHPPLVHQATSGTSFLSSSWQFKAVKACYVFWKLSSLIHIGTYSTWTYFMPMYV